MLNLDQDGKKPSEYLKAKLRGVLIRSRNTPVPKPKRKVIEKCIEDSHNISF